MTGDLFVLIYFGLSAASIAAMTVFLILRQSKPVPVRILLLVTVFLLPFTLGWLLCEPLRRHSGNVHHLSLTWTLKKCLDDEKISDRDLAAAWNTADIGSLHTNLWKLLPEPRIPRTVDAKIKTGPLELKPADRYYRRPLPRSAGRADYAGTPGFSERMQELKEELSGAYWAGRHGVIVTGQLRLEGERGVLGVGSRSPYFPNGVFAHALYPDQERELQFFKSGYDPVTIWLDPAKRHPKRLDLGVIEMKKCAHPAELSFSLQLPENVTEAKIRLRTGWPAPTWPDWGHECGAPIHSVVAERTVKAGEPVRIGELSGIPYELKFTAPGCVSRTFYFTGDRSLDLGSIALAPIRMQTFRMRPFAGGPWEEITLELNGDTELVIVPKDEYGNTVGLALTPDRGSDRILADFTWRPVYFDDYGETAGETEPLPEPKRYQGTVFLQPGHLYRMRNESKKADVLIRLLPNVRPKAE
ncbi:MAG: hypothetical protein E7055_07660 [Lentisphaerae bacterium]|nr:hypothetical protein [Lentisphaerota bacterium]